MPTTYTRMFDPYHPDWTRDKITNFKYLRDKENRANAMLKSKGHLFLNNVLFLLGYPPTKLGDELGWSKKLNSKDIRFSVTKQLYGALSVGIQPDGLVEHTITLITGVDEAPHPDSSVVSRLTEVAISDCTNGCKIYADPRSQFRVLAHYSAYGCTVTKKELIA